MEHGFGGMFMIRIMIVFVFIYVMFIGIALNIAKVYRIKNGVINILEQYQFDMFNDTTNVLDNMSPGSGKLSQYLNKIPYTVGQNRDSNVAVEKFCEAVDGAKDDSGNKYYKTQSGVCIVKIGEISYHYKVYVFMSVDFPLFGLNNKLIPVSGETVTMD